MSDSLDHLYRLRSVERLEWLEDFYRKILNVDRPDPYEPLMGHRFRLYVTLDDEEIPWAEYRERQ